MTGKRPTRRKDPAKKLEALLRSIERKLKAEDFKFTVGDYLRILQTYQEIERDVPRDIEVTWVESLTERSESEK